MPCYDLSEIKRLVKKDKYVLQGNTQRDCDNLGYCHETIKEIVGGLKQSEFIKTNEYTTAKNHKVLQFDAYKTAYAWYCYEEEEVKTDELYVKLSITATGSLVLIASLHGHR